MFHVSLAKLTHFSHKALTLCTRISLFVGFFMGVIHVKRKGLLYNLNKT